MIVHLLKDDVNIIAVTVMIRAFLGRRRRASHDAVSIGAAAGDGVAASARILTVDGQRLVMAVAAGCR